MSELIFNLTQEEDGYCAPANWRTHRDSGDTWSELREMVIDTAMSYFYDSEPLPRISLYLTHAEVLKVA